jgi:hypothetical protein
MRKPKLNNHYLIMRKENEWFDFSYDGEEYYLYPCKEEHFNEIPTEDYIYYRVKNIDIYVVMEPASERIVNKQNQIRLLRNLPKHWRGVITKWDMEKVITDLKNKTLING